MVRHAEALKQLLVLTLAGNHPAAPIEIDRDKFSACRKFLANFIGKNISAPGYVFTLNYDLLLYWTLMHEEDNFSNEKTDLNRGDGFGNDENDPDADYVVWQGETAAHSANVYYLHGALHLFDAGSELQKYTWSRSGVGLVEQAQAAIEQNKFPLFVSEGDSDHKKRKIRHNAYLYQGYKVFTSNAEQPKHGFFIYGHSLADNDNHLLYRLARGKFRKLYVSIYGDPQSAVNQSVVRKAEYLVDLREQRYPLDVAFFDAESAAVWG